jgi:hypothetical protein
MAPTVTKQDFIDCLTLPHEGGLFPYTPASHGSATGPNCSYSQWGSAEGGHHLIPGAVSFNGIEGAWWWGELATEEGSADLGPGHKVVIEGAGFAWLSKTTGNWTKTTDSLAHVAGMGYVWSGNPGGEFPRDENILGQPRYGWGSSGSGGDFGDLVSDSLLGIDGRIRCHFFSQWGVGNNAEMFWASNNPSASDPTTETSNPDITADVAGVVWWVTVHVEGGGSGYRLMTGVDLFADGASATPGVGGRGGYNARARILPSDGSSITIVGTTCSIEQIDVHPPTVVPGYGGSSPTSGTGLGAPAGWTVNGNPKIGHSKTQDNIFPTAFQGSKITNIHVYGWGSLWPSTDSAIDPSERDGGTTVLAAIQQAKADGQEPMLTLATCPEYYRLPGGAGGFAGIEEAPDPAKVTELATAYKNFVDTYYPYGVRRVQIWNEFKGMWYTEPGNYGAMSGWDMDRYLDLYNQTYTLIKAARPSVQIYGPYVPLRSRGDNATFTGPLGSVSISQSDVDALIAFKDNATFDGICLDGDFSIADWPKVISFVRTLLPVNTPIIISEFYHGGADLANVLSAIKPALDSRDAVLWWSETALGTFTVPISGGGSGSGGTPGGSGSGGPGGSGGQTGGTVDHTQAYTLGRNDSGKIKIQTTTVDGDPQPVRLSIAGLPIGTNYIFEKKTIMSGESTWLKLTTSPSTSYGNFNCKLILTGDHFTDVEEFTFRVVEGAGAVIPGSPTPAFTVKAAFEAFPNLNSSGIGHHGEWESNLPWAGYYQIKALKPVGVSVMLQDSSNTGNITMVAVNSSNQIINTIPLTASPQTLWQGHFVDDYVNFFIYGESSRNAGPSSFTLRFLGDNKADVLFAGSFNNVSHATPLLPVLTHSGEMGISSTDPTLGAPTPISTLTVGDEWWAYLIDLNIENTDIVFLESKLDISDNAGYIETTVDVDGDLTTFTTPLGIWLYGQLYEDMPPVDFIQHGIAAEPGDLEISLVFRSVGGFGETHTASATIDAPPGWPTITSFSPEAGISDGGTSVVITGTNFSYGAGITSVKFGTTEADSFTVDSDTQITAVSPALTGSEHISVTNAIGTSHSTAPFSFLEQPVVTSLSVSEAYVGDVITITGTGFTGTTAVNFTSTPAVSFTVVDNTTITVTVPTLSAATYAVRVVNPIGTSAESSADLLSVLGAIPLPTLSAIDPPTVLTTGGTVTLTGTNLATTQAIHMNGIYDSKTITLGITIVSNTEVSFAAPQGVDKAPYTVLIENRTGVSEFGQTLTYNNTPAPVGWEISEISGWTDPRTDPPTNHLPIQGSYTFTRRLTDDSVNHTPNGGELHAWIESVGYPVVVPPGTNPYVGIGPSGSMGATADSLGCYYYSPPTGTPVPAPWTGQTAMDKTMWVISGKVKVGCYLTNCRLIVDSLDEALGPMSVGWGGLPYGGTNWHEGDNKLLTETWIPDIGFVGTLPWNATGSWLPPNGVMYANGIYFYGWVGRSDVYTSPRDAHVKIRLQSDQQEIVFIDDTVHLKEAPSGVFWGP